MARKSSKRLYANDDRKAMSGTPGHNKKPRSGKARKSSRY